MYKYLQAILFFLISSFLSGCLLHSNGNSPTLQLVEKEQYRPDSDLNIISIDHEYTSATGQSCQIISTDMGVKLRCLAGEVWVVVPEIFSANRS